MGRGVYEHELNDPDFHWLFDEFQKRSAGYVLVNNGPGPLSFVKAESIIIPVKVATGNTPEDTLPEEDVEAADLLFTFRREE